MLFPVLQGCYTGLCIDLVTSVYSRTSTVACDSYCKYIVYATCNLDHPFSVDIDLNKNVCKFLGDFNTICMQGSLVPDLGSV